MKLDPAASIADSALRASWDVWPFPYSSESSRRAREQYRLVCGAIYDGAELAPVQHWTKENNFGLW